MALWTNMVNADKKISIACGIKFYEDYEKVLIFVLEMGEMYISHTFDNGLMYN